MSEVPLYPTLVRACQPGRRTSITQRLVGKECSTYRGTSLIRKRTPVGPCRRPMPGRPWFRGGLVFKAHRRAYHSTLGWRVIKTKDGTRPVHLIITMMKWIRTSRLSKTNSLDGRPWRRSATRRRGGAARSAPPKSQFPQKIVNLFFIVVIIKDTLTDLCEN